VAGSVSAEHQAEMKHQGSQELPQHYCCPALGPPASVPAPAVAPCVVSFLLG
jgi:hypothetical protein